LIRSVDLLISLIFLADFLYRLFTAGSKRVYFGRQMGWLDLISSLPLPQAKIARLGRVLRSLVLARELGMRSAWQSVKTVRAEAAVYLVTFLIILVLEFGSAAMLAVEARSPEAQITDAGKALWWSIVTISTVGYGDLVPVTQLGHLIGFFVVIVGVALFGVVTGTLANHFVSKGNQDRARAGSGDGSQEWQEVGREIARLRTMQQASYDDLVQRIERLQHLYEKGSAERDS
jgi:voltage-gated potassium channel